MPRSYRTSRTQRGLTRAQRWELLRGPSPARGQAFESHEARQKAYTKHETELLVATNPGTRCWAWWEYRIGWHPAESQREVLQRLGLLSDLEREAMGLPWSPALRREIAEADFTRRRVNLPEETVSPEHQDPRSVLWTVK